MVIYAVLVGLFFWKEDIVKYILLGFLFIWLLMQSVNFITRSPTRIANYNKLFENTHHIIPSSEKIVIPDTYHFILILLVLITFVINILYIIMM